jgi:hypothetical protein
MTDTTEAALLPEPSTGYVQGCVPGWERPEDPNRCTTCDCRLVPGTEPGQTAQERHPTRIDQCMAHGAIWAANEERRAVP